MCLGSKKNKQKTELLVAELLFEVKHLEIFEKRGCNFFVYYSIHWKYVFGYRLSETHAL